VCQHLVDVAVLLTKHIELSLTLDLGCDSHGQLSQWGVRMLGIDNCHECNKGQLLCRQGQDRDTPAMDTHRTLPIQYLLLESLHSGYKFVHPPSNQSLLRCQGVTLG